MDFCVAGLSFSVPGTEQGRISPVKEVPSNSSPCKDFSARSRNAVPFAGE